MSARLLTLTREYPECWHYMPAVLERVATFCTKYDTDTKPEYMVRQVSTHFVADDERQTVRAIAGLIDDRLVGHCVISLDSWCGTGIVTIAQFELDEPMPRAVIRDGLEQIAWWGKSRGGAIMRLWAIQDDSRGAARTRLFRMLYGFQPARMISDKAL